ncbi:MAG: radical SAM protein, partial [Candidatus Korarchaeota archaeon]
RAQRKLLAGYKGHPDVSIERFLEAMHPVHFAISLDGEPMLYPYIAELVDEINKRGWTAFIVTNGTVPEKLREMIEKKIIPTNLYISVYETNPEDYVKITNSFIPNPFERVKRSLELMREFERLGCRTVFRVTAVREINLKSPEGYAQLIRMSQPMFVEFKGYSWAGESTKRLTKEHMPSLKELQTFADEVARLVGYSVREVDEKSRVVMLVRDENTWNKNLELIKAQNERIAEYDKKWRTKYEKFSWQTQLKIDLFELP